MMMMMMFSKVELQHVGDKSRSHVSQDNYNNEDGNDDSSDEHNNNDDMIPSILILCSMEIKYCCCGPTTDPGRQIRHLQFKMHE
jgi:hypothetical protein